VTRQNVLEATYRSVKLEPFRADALDCALAIALELAKRRCGVRPDLVVSLETGSISLSTRQGVAAEVQLLEGVTLEVVAQTLAEAICVEAVDYRPLETSPTDVN
jgi:hypothetical protein